MAQKEIDISKYGSLVLKNVDIREWSTTKGNVKSKVVQLKLQAMVCPVSEEDQ